MKKFVFWIAFSIIAFAVQYDTGFLTKKIFYRKAVLSQWVKIPYGALLDQSIITHSGKTVRAVIEDIPTHDDSAKALVQRYLEPFSYLCHENLSSVKGTLNLPLINIMTHYPAGSEQPAWANLFREGHFQLYYNRTLIRIFLKGLNAESSFRQYQSVIRHPIKDVMSSDGIKIKTIEVYAFNNDYAKTELSLNIIPVIYNAEEIDLSPAHKSLDLNSIEDFLKTGVTPEAVEVDKSNNLLLYGKKGLQTIGGQPLSIADIAVVYRSIFHHGYNEPYISLDTHEDNRYAKVNFGGHFENTRVGNVVLEADKLFKLLCTGINPNTKKYEAPQISNNVPGFLTQQERTFIEDSNKTGQRQIRYWFYPDEIGMVSDGTIGAVRSSQFLADAERMDVQMKLDRPIRDTIDHLNSNYQYYERANTTYKELSCVGRIMAIVNWLKEMKTDKKIELDELLTVRLPAFSTPLKTQKMWVITAAAYPGAVRLSGQNIRKYTKTYNLSPLLDKYSPTVSDEMFLEEASKHFKKMDPDSFYPAQYRKLKSQVEGYEGLLNRNDKKLKKIDQDIDRGKMTLNRYSDKDIDNYNKLVEDYNDLTANQKKLIDKYNAGVNVLNEMNVLSYSIASIGGGIELSPKSFRKTSINPKAPEIKELIRVKDSLKPVGNIFQSGNWIRSNPGIGGGRINKLPFIKPQPLQSDDWIHSNPCNGGGRINKLSLGMTHQEPK
jgi:hypothetical protein